MEREFVAPGPGTWVLDTTHSAAAMTHYSGSCFDGLARGFGEGMTRYGLLLSRVQPHFEHGFMYAQQVGLMGKPGGGLPPKLLFQAMFWVHPTLRSRVKAAHESYNSRLWLDDLREWDEMKLDSIVRNTALQSVDLRALDDAALIEHLDACYENANEMVYRHHKFSIGAVLPVGRFLDVATRCTGLSPAEVVPMLKGSTEVSTGIAKQELAVLAQAIQGAGIAKDVLESQSAELALATLRETPAIAAALDAYLVKTGYMLIGGYCISEKTLRESPNIILARINEALAPPRKSNQDDALQQAVLDKVAEADRAEFDAALNDAREANRMRDERGIYNDIWGSGISRTAILEAGRRLSETGVFGTADLALDASHEELVSLLRGETVVDVATLSERQHWRNTKSIDEVPEFLGPAPQDPPPMEWLPAKIQPTMRAFAMVMGNIWDEPQEMVAEKIVGTPVSPGVYEGTAKVILSTKDFDRLEEGDVLITKNTSAGFNVVLPIIGALVTDRGGILSHAAIVSREFGIPGIVGTKNSTQAITEGSRVRVDGNTGEVTILS